MNHPVRTILQQDRATNISEYLLVAAPDEIMVRKLEAYQDFLLKNFFPNGERLPIRSVALAGLVAKDYLEETLSRWIMKVCRMRPSFTITLETHATCRNGVLFLEARDSMELRSFHLQLGVIDDFLHASDCIPLQIISKPQLPLLIPNESVNGRSFSFKIDFTLTEIAMLKRNMTEDRFDKIDVFGFSGQTMF